MKYCSSCGEQINDKAVICPHCGSAQNGYVEDRATAGVKAVSFLFPIVGLILYIVNERNAPNKARSIIKWTLWGFLLPICITVLFFLLAGLIAAAI